MRTELSLSPALYPYRTITSSHAAVAIDLLRATTAICAAFQAGCSEVVPLDSLEALASYRRQGYLIAAERNGSKVGVPDGHVSSLAAEYGNSPTEYLRSDLHGVRLAYSTTNGTVAILRAADADLTLVGAFANLTALCDRLCRENRDTVILCSGWKSDFCLEDTLVAGAVIERCQADPVGDAARMALHLWRQAQHDPLAFCAEASHVHRLCNLGAEADVRFAFCLDTCPVVPVMKEGRLTL
ncbi:MAG: 2-phosphosulfolactate phosphatase [Bacteroidales bacterium]|nr:2-phosphosulfolactate phosphatase [Bacteroidales bacterium]